MIPVLVEEKEEQKFYEQIIGDSGRKRSQSDGNARG
jgi:hypothetical protein